MPPVTLRCFACRARHPAAIVATLADGRPLGLCRRCAASRAHRATFIAAFQAHRHATLRAAHAAPALAAARHPAPTARHRVAAGPTPAAAR